MVPDASHIHIASIEARNHLLALKHGADETRRKEVAREEGQQFNAICRSLSLIVLHGGNEACCTCFVRLLWLFLDVVDIVEVHDTQLFLLVREFDMRGGQSLCLAGSLKNRAWSRNLTCMFRFKAAHLRQQFKF